MEFLLRMSAQGAEVSFFEGSAVSSMITIHAVASLSAEEINPVGGFVAGSLKMGALDQGFKQQRPVSVKLFPILGQAMSGKRKDFARQTANGSERRDEESTVGKNELKIPLALLRAPTDPGIVQRHRPFRAGKL